MSSSVYIYKISKEDIQKHPDLAVALKGEPLDSVDVSLGEAEGFSLYWISPRIGNLMDGLLEHAPKIWNSLGRYLITKEQLLGVIEMSRAVAKRDKPEFHDPEDFYGYLMKEFDELEHRLSEFDFDKEILIAGSS